MHWRIRAAALAIFSVLASPAFAENGRYLTFWTAEQVAAIERNQSNTIPPIRAAEFPAIYPEHYGWDFWPVVDRANRIATIEGRLMVMSLAVPRSVSPGERHTQARIRFATSEDNGASWRDGGWVFEGGPEPIGAWQWSAHAVYDANARRLHVFYTGVEANYAAAAASPQVIAHASADVAIVEGQLRLRDWSRHRILLQPDNALFYGQYDGEDNKGLLMSFRDPWVHIDDAAGRAYMVFSSRMATRLQTMNGQIGLATAPADDLTNWTLLPPILAAPGINGELEIPQIVRQGDRYLLFFATQRRTFNRQQNAPNGLYGWTAPSVRGPWRALNGTGLVLANPAEQPLGLYGHKVTPELQVLTFIDTPATDQNTLDGKDGDWMRENWIGTLGPVITFEVEGERTRFRASHPTLRAAREATPTSR